MVDSIVVRSQILYFRDRRSLIHGQVSQCLGRPLSPSMGLAGGLSVHFAFVVVPGGKAARASRMAPDLGMESTLHN